MRSRNALVDDLVVEIGGGLHQNFDDFLHLRILILGRLLLERAEHVRIVRFSDGCIQLVEVADQGGVQLVALLQAVVWVAVEFAVLGLIWSLQVSMAARASFNLTSISSSHGPGIPWSAYDRWLRRLSAFSSSIPGAGAHGPR